MGDPQLTVSGFSTKMLLLLLCLFGTLGGVVAQTSSGYPVTELAGLRALREAWNNTPNPSTTFENWEANTDPCGLAGGDKWAGVSFCREQSVIDAAGNTTQKNISVAGLTFSGASLTGKIPPQISLLSGLEGLYLINNPNLSGPIPKEFELLLYLRSIDLSDNSLSGELSSTNISQLQQLYDMKFARNRFQGSIKQDYFQGLNLAYLNLSMNNFTGVCPDISTLRNLTNLDLSSNNFTGPLPDFKHLSSLDFLDLSSNNFTGPLPDFKYLPNLKTLNVSSNHFTGLSHNLSLFWSTLPLGLSVLKLSSLEIKGPLPVWSTMTNSTFSELYLDDNHLTGTLNVSELVASTVGKNLNVLSLQNNNISEIVTTNGLLEGVYMRIFLQGNPYCSKAWPSEDAATKCFFVCGNNCIYKPSTNWKVILSTSIGSSVVILLLAIVAFAFVLRRNKRYTQVLLKEIERADIGAKRFEYNQLCMATRNFALEMKLGAGAFGAVYKGILENDDVVAVKQLFLETNQGKDNFLNEVFLISNLQHRNLVTLRGYCLHSKQTLLIYDFVDNCDLDKVLLSRHNIASDSFGDLEMKMTWPARMKVCRGVAQGLFYLHASSQSRIIHRDIKASNILLDKSFHAKIADFGLARLMEDTKSIIYTQQCAGTMGYLAPEYACNGELSEKADIFSFGVLLLEIVSGKRNTDITMPDDEVYLPNLAKKLHRENKLTDVQDASLVVSANEALEVQKVLDIALLCVQNAPKKRPSMFQVAAMLEGDVEVQPVAYNDNSSNSWPQDMTRISIDFESECPLFPLSASTPQSDGGLLTNGNGTLELSIVQSGR